MDLANPTVSDGKFKALLWVYGANHNQFNSIWASETPPASRCRAPSQEQIAKVHLGALAQALLLDRVEYMDVLRDHATAGDVGCPRASTSCRSIRIRNACSCSTSRKASWRPQVSLPVQGTVAADGVVAARQLKDLVNAGGPQTTTITLRLEWNAPRARACC